MEPESVFLIDAEEASKLTGVPKSTLHLWAAARDAGEYNDGPSHYALGPRRRMWDRADLLAWLASKRV
ncbi:hypothetical protein BJH93_10595 [Kocuria polaris]|nr:hypothetical protein [Kocuria polaris]